MQPASPLVVARWVALVAFLYAGPLEGDEYTADSRSASAAASRVTLDLPVTLQATAVWAADFDPDRTLDTGFWREPSDHAVPVTFLPGIPVELPPASFLPEPVTFERDASFSRPAAEVAALLI
jgi:hypothetical protein